MELIKELPEVFEEFAEQRQKSFLAMKGLKDQYPMRQSRTQIKTCQRTYVH